jgi:hypothetical protein
MKKPWHAHSRRLTRWREGLLILFALPLAMVANLYAYSRLQKGWSAQVGVFIVFVPVIVITSRSGSRRGLSPLASHSISCRGADRSDRLRGVLNKVSHSPTAPTGPS